MATNNTALTTQTPKAGIVAKFAERFEVEAQKVMSLVAATVFKQAQNEPPLSPEETAAALIVSNAYDLNPFTKEIYAFRSKGKLLIVVSVDGWSRIVNRQSQLNGIEFEEHFDDKGKIQAVTCKIHRKDCALPIVITEYTHECKRDTLPWNTMPIRMTRNRAFIQCARVAFSVSGIVDDDEAQTIEGSPEFVPAAERAIIDQSINKADAIKNVVRSRARNVKQDAQPAQTQQLEQQREEAPAREVQAENVSYEQAEPEQSQQTQQQQNQPASNENW